MAGGGQVQVKSRIMPVMDVVESPPRLSVPFRQVVGFRILHSARLFDALLVYDPLYRANTFARYTWQLLVMSTGFVEHPFD